MLLILLMNNYLFQIPLARFSKIKYVCKGPKTEPKIKVTQVPRIIPDEPNSKFLAKKIDSGMLILIAIILEYIWSLILLTPFKKDAKTLFQVLIIANRAINKDNINGISNLSPIQKL